MTIVVLDDKNAKYKGQPYSLSALASLLTGIKSVAGPRYFKY